MTIEEIQRVYFCLGFLMGSTTISGVYSLCWLLFKDDEE